MFASSSACPTILVWPWRVNTHHQDCFVPVAHKRAGASVVRDYYGVVIDEASRSKIIRCTPFRLYPCALFPSVIGWSGNRSRTWHVTRYVTPYGAKSHLGYFKALDITVWRAYGQGRCLLAVTHTNDARVCYHYSTNYVYAAHRQSLPVATKKCTTSPQGYRNTRKIIKKRRRCLVANSPTHCTNTTKRRAEQQYCYCSTTVRSIVPGK